MEIFEHANTWTEHFNSGWLNHLDTTGEIDWKQYQYVRNHSAINAPGLDPARARLLLVSTAGAYIRGQQPAFNAAAPRGDYSIRTFPVTTPFADLDYAHDHYDHAARQQDPRVNLPLNYLAEMVTRGNLGSMTESVVSFSGYHPDARSVVDEMVPEILQVAEKEQAQAALLVPV